MVGGRPGQRERCFGPLRDREVGDGLHVLAFELAIGLEHVAVGACDRRAATVGEAADPRNRGPIVGAQHDLHPHRHRAALAADDADDVAMALATPHGVDQHHRALGGLEPRLEHERVLAVGARRPGDRHRGSDLPAAVAVVAQQRREEGARIEARQGHPIDRAVEPDEAGALAIADQSVIFDPERHGRCGLLSVGSADHVAPLGPTRRRPSGSGQPSQALAEQREDAVGIDVP